MRIPIWCLIAPMFLVSAKAGLHDVVAQSFYEEPPSSSPAPTVRTQSHRPDLIGMKEVVLFLTPDQVHTLQAAGAVVQPYPEYENDFIALQQQFRQSVEQPNVQQYQTWMNPVEEQKDNAGVLNYFKHLNIQEINDDLSQKTLATEATTEKTTATPRYKYTKARQQYKEKEYSTPYAPKKASRPKITDQSNNAETYVRFLPHYEHENLQMVPYQALPLSPYQFAQIEANAHIKTNEEAQVHYQANAMAQPVVFNMNNETAQPNTFTSVNSEAQQNAFNFSNSEVQQSAFNAANEMVQQIAFHLSNTVTPQPAFNVANTEAPQKVFIQTSTEANRNALSQDNIVAKQNAFFQETAEAQQNTYAQKTAEGQQNAYSQADTKAKINTFTRVNTQTTDSGMDGRLQAKPVTQQTAFTQVNTEAEQKAYSQENKEGQKNIHPQVNTEAQQNIYILVKTQAQRNDDEYSQETKEGQNNLHSQVNTEANRNTYPQTSLTKQNASTVAQKEIYRKETTKAQPNDLLQISTVTQRNSFSQTNSAQKTTNTVTNQRLQQNENSQLGTVVQNTADGITTTEALSNDSSHSNAVTQKNLLSQLNPPQKITNIVAYQRAQQNAYNKVLKTTKNLTHTETQRNISSQANAAAHQTNNNTVPKTTKNVTHAETQRNVYNQANAADHHTINSEANIKTQEGAYYKVNTDQEPTKTDANTGAQRYVYSQADVVGQQTDNTKAPQPNAEAPQIIYSQANKVSHHTAGTVANTEIRPNIYTEATTKAQQNTYTESSTKAQQNLYSRPNKESQRNVYKPTRPSRVQVPKGTKKLQGLEKVPASLVTPGKTYFVSQGKKDFKETLSSIEGLPPLLPLTPVTPLERQTEKPATPAPTLPTPQTSILHKDRFSLLLAPLYQHQTITDTISRQKEELLKIEYNIRTKLQKMKESPQYYDQREYNTELEKLTKNLSEQNDLARIEASTVTPTGFATEGSVSTESQPIELVRSTEPPTIVRIPKPHHFNIPAPYSAPLEYIQAFRVSQPVVGGKRPVEGVRNVYVKVDKPYTISRFAPFTEKQKIPVPVMFPINAEQLKIIRHIWEH